MQKYTRRDMLKVAAGAGLAAGAAPLIGPGWAVAAGTAQTVVLRVPIGPTPVAQMGEIVYGYELHIGRALSLNLTVTRVEILADGKLVKTYQGKELAQCLIRKPDPFSVDDAVFNGRDFQVLFAWPILSASARVPRQFTHRVQFSNGRIARGGVAPVSKAETLIGPPVKGDRWWAGNGTSNFDRHHRSALLDIRSRFTIAQRFATDWLPVGPDGLAYTGDGSKCTDYYGYGADLLAVAAGEVIEARDGIPDNVPPKNYAPTTIQNVFGNFVILDIGGGRYAAYAHVIPGTLKVKIGDTVTMGQVIGKLGNSGNSTAPHLHFHICNGRDGIDSEGLPFSFARYDLLGTLSSRDFDARKPWIPGTPQTRLAEMPMREQVVRLQG